MAEKWIKVMVGGSPLVFAGYSVEQSGARRRFIDPGTGIVTHRYEISPDGLQVRLEFPFCDTKFHPPTPRKQP